MDLLSVEGKNLNVSSLCSCHQQSIPPVMTNEKLTADGLPSLEGTSLDRTQTLVRLCVPTFDCNSARREATLHHVHSSTHQSLSSPTERIFSSPLLVPCVLGQPYSMEHNLFTHTTHITLRKFASANRFIHRTNDNPLYGLPWLPQQRMVPLGGVYSASDTVTADTTNQNQNQSLPAV
jgi:hypothetical protein